MDNMNIKYPEVKVKLVGEDSNAFFILAKVGRAMRLAGVDKADIEAFKGEALSSDYDNLLRVVMAWVTVDDDNKLERDEW